MNVDYRADYENVTCDLLTCTKETKNSHKRNAFTHELTKETYSPIEKRPIHFRDPWAYLSGVSVCRDTFRDVSQKFSKVSWLPDWLCKITMELTFENICQLRLETPSVIGRRGRRSRFTTRVIWRDVGSWMMRAVGAWGRSVVVKAGAQVNELWHTCNESCHIYIYMKIDVGSWIMRAVGVHSQNSTRRWIYRIKRLTTANWE